MSEQQGVLLLVVGAAGDMELMLSELWRAGFEPRSRRVETARAMAAALEQEPWDAILADDTLPGFDPAAALRLLERSRHGVPLIVVSSGSGDESASELMRAGARDYLARQSWARLGPVLKRELQSAAPLRARRIPAKDADHLAAIVRNAEEAVIGKDLNGFITFWNPAAERLFGWTTSEAIGRHISIIVPTHLTAEFQESLGRIRRGERILQRQTLRRRKDGSEIDVACTMSPIRDGQGRVVGTSAFVRDITEKKWLDEQLRMSELRFRCLYESDIVAMGCWHVDGRIIDGNNALLRLLGYTREEMAEGKVRWTEITPPEYADLDARALQEMRATGVCTPFEKEYIRKDRSRVPILIAGALFGEGVTDAGLLIAVDLTELKKAEEVRQRQSRILNCVLSSMADGVVVLDERGKFLLCNPAAKQILGMGETDLRMADWSPQGLFLPDQVTPCPHPDLPLIRAIRGEHVPATELFVRNEHLPQGTWISTLARPLQDETGRLCGGVAVFRDMTERKRVEEALRQRDTNIRLLLDSTAEAIYGIDRRGNCTFANAACARLLGYSEPGALVGKNIAAGCRAPSVGGGHGIDRNLW